MSNDDVRFKDFSRKRKPIFFILDGPTPEGDRYDCYTALALPSLQEIALIAGNMTAENATESFAEFFKVVLLPESAARIEEKLKDRLYPMDPEQANEIMSWLMEVYGLRPSQPSSVSSDGSPTGDGGTPSVVGVSVVDSIL